MRAGLICVICGGAFSFSKIKGANPKVCSEDCRKAYQREYQRTRNLERSTVSRSEFDARSAARMLEAAERRGDVHSAHVRLYERTYTPGQRLVISCRKCAAQMRVFECVIGAGNRKRCPVCNAEPGRDPEKKKAAGRATYHRKTDEQKRALAQRSVVRAREKRKDDEHRKKLAKKKRLARICGTNGEKPAKHDAHVKAWAAWKKTLPIERKRPFRDELHDAHVRLWKSDDARIARWRVQFDPAYRLNMRMRVSIRKALHGNKAGRSWERIVGYTLSELQHHFERMLPNGRALDEVLKEGWHIDHIVPKSTYNLADERELAKAWCMSNLRLLPAKHNMRKGSKREFLV